MKQHSLLIAGALALALSACHPVTDYTDSEAPKTVLLDHAAARIDVRFAPGSSRLLAGDMAQLRALAASGRIAPSDRITVSASGGPALAAARFNAIAAVLLPYRIIADERTLAAVPPNRAIIDTGRYLVTLPPCPNWSKEPGVDFGNAHASNFGCTTAVNLGLMVANPADLAEGRPVGLADAVPAAAAMQRYQGDKVQLPAVSALGPIAATSNGPTGSGATGSGTSGSQP